MKKRIWFTIAWLIGTVIILGLVGNIDAEWFWPWPNQINPARVWRILLTLYALATVYMLNLTPRAIRAKFHSLYNRPTTSSSLRNDSKPLKLHHDTPKHQKTNQSTTTSSRLWRFLRVLYFMVSIPLLFFFVAMLLTTIPYFKGDNYDYGMSLYLIIYMMLWYIILTDIFARIVHYIKDWQRIWVLSLGSLFRRHKYWIIVLIALLGLAHWYSYHLQSYCNWSYQFLNQDGGCNCTWSRIYKNNTCEEVDSEELFSGFSQDEIEWLIREAKGYSGVEKIEFMKWLYHQYLHIVSGYNQYPHDFKQYQIWSLSLKIPKPMKVSSDTFDHFVISPNKNIHISKETFDSLVGECIKNPWLIEPTNWQEKKEFLKDQMRVQDQYTKFFKDILSGNFNDWPVEDGEENDGYDWFDSYSCGYTRWPVNFKNITINGINGVIIDYNATGDPELDCWTSFFKEVLLVKSFDEIYRITFDYNFGIYGDKIVERWLRKWTLEDQVKNYYWSVCRDDIQKKAREYWNVVYAMESYLKGNNSNNFYLEYLSPLFVQNDKIINHIINTIQIYPS